MTFWTWQSNTWLAQPWTLLTAPLVHLSTAHALANGLALAVLLVMAWQRLVLRSFAIGLLFIWPLSTLSLIFCPQVTHYVGLSGALHGGATLLALLLIRSAPRGFVGWALLAGVFLKLYLEQAWRQPIVWSADWGFYVVVIAHLYGAGVGLLIGAVQTLRQAQGER